MTERTARRIALTLLRRIHVGRLTVVEGERRTVIGEGAPQATIVVRSPRTWREVLRGGLGLGESYADGLWDTPDLTAVIELAARNMGGIDELRRRLSPIREPYQRGRQLLTRNTPERAREGIHAHYDLGNDLFSAILDPSMTYSCAVFERRDQSLQEAQEAKLERMCRKLDIGEGDRVLEIGTGWGSFAVHAARTRGCHVTTTTLSDEQHALAVGRVADAGLSDRVTVLHRDYRELDGTFDKLVSIEMIEAVGWKDFGTFFDVCARRLEANGAMGLQAITVDDRLYDVEKASRTFIRKHIFPDGCLPSIEVIARAVARHSDLRMVALEDITAHYPETLRRWRENLDANARRARAAAATTSVSSASGACTCAGARRGSPRAASPTSRSSSASPRGTAPCPSPTTRQGPRCTARRPGRATGCRRKHVPPPHSSAARGSPTPWGSSRRPSSSPGPGSDRPWCSRRRRSRCAASRSGRSGSRPAGCSHRCAARRVRPWLVAQIAGDLSDVLASVWGRNGIPPSAVSAVTAVGGASAAITAGAALAVDS